MLLFYQMMRTGGPVMWIILFCGAVAMFIFLERWFHFHREHVNVSELVRGLKNVLRRDGFIEAVSLCDNTPGPVARVLMSAIQAKKDGEEDLRQAVEDTVLVETPRLERRLNILATIGYISPLLGLLGTVFGMMGALQTIQAKEGVYLSAADLSGDISMALVATAAGLCVAIPSCVAYNYLISRVESFSVEIERASSEIIYFFKHYKPGQAATENGGEGNGNGNGEKL
jgi:biopolymer transport protein ExbB